MPGEEIRWTGKPQPNFMNHKTSILDRILSIGDSLEKIALLLFLILSTILFLIGIIDFKTYIVFPIIYFGYFLLFYLWNSMDKKSFQSVKYVLTNKRVFFQSWSIFKGAQKQSLELNKIQKLSLEEFDNNIETIHFMGPNLRSLITIKNLATQESKHYPIFELIENAKNLLPEINALIQENKK